MLSRRIRLLAMSVVPGIVAPHASGTTGTPHSRGNRAHQDHRTTEATAATKPPRPRKHHAHGALFPRDHRSPRVIAPPSRLAPAMPCPSRPRPCHSTPPSLHDGGGLSVGADSSFLGAWGAVQAPSTTPAIAHAAAEGRVWHGLARCYPCRSRKEAGRCGVGRGPLGRSLAMGVMAGRGRTGPAEGVVG